MKTPLRLLVEIEKGIQGALDKTADHGLWDHYIHPDLARDMSNAAAIVFEAAQKAQAFKAKEDAQCASPT